MTNPDPRGARFGWQLAGVLVLVLAGQTVLAAFVVGAALTLGLSRATSAPIGLWMPIGLILMLALFNSMKWPDSDLGNYYQYLDLAARSSVGRLLTDSDTFLSIKSSEFSFRLLTWILAALGRGSHVFFSFVTTTLIYGSALATCLVLMPGRDFPGDGDPRRLSGLAVPLCAGLAAGLTFSLTGHLIRQYLAGGLFTVSVASWAASGRRAPLLVALLACTLHNSAVALLLPLALTMVYRRSMLVFLAGLVLMIAASMSGPFTTLLQFSQQLSADGDGGRQPLALLLMDLGLLVIALLASRNLPSKLAARKPAMHTMLAFSVATAAMLFSIRDAPFLLFRLYMYVEFLRTPLIAFVLHALLQRSGALRTAVSLCVLASSLSILAWRAGQSDWEYLPVSHPIRALTLPGVIDRWATVEDQ